MIIFKIFPKKFLGLLFLVLIITSCKKDIKKEYEKVYLVKLNSYNIGYCFKYKDVKECNIYFYNNSKKITLNSKLTIKNSQYYYQDSEFKLSFKTDKQVYPFLFDNFNKKDKIYYPKENIEIPVSKLGIRKIKNGYIALPFEYIKVKKIPKIDQIDIKKIKSFKVKRINEDYLMNLRVEIKSKYLPPNDLRQRCSFVRDSDNKVVCNLYRGGEIENLSKSNKNNLKIDKIDKKISQSKKLKQFLKKYNIKKEENLIPNLINSLHKEIKYKDVSQKNDTEKILTTKVGDCTEFSHVAKDSLLFLGIKAKKVYGLVYQNNKFVYHSWVEYSKDKKTYAFDPTLKRVLLSPYYITLTKENSYGIMVMPLIEDIKIISKVK